MSNDDFSSYDVSIGNEPGFARAKVAMACEEGGADAISATSCPGAAPPVDIYNEGMPLNPGVENMTLGGGSGPWLKPLAFAGVARIAKNIKIPIAGGGLSDWKDSVQMIMYGATVVTFHTIIMMRGWEILPAVEKGMLRFMKEKNYESIKDFKGLVLKRIVDPQKVIFVPIKISIDPKICNGCGACTKIGHCEALALENKKAVWNADQCIECGCCSYTCPVGAITLTKKT